MEHPIGPKIQSQHLTGNIGEALVRIVFSRAGVPTISVNEEDDYGTDLLVQVPRNEANRLSGLLVRVQVKCGGSKYHSADGTGRCYLSEEHRAYYADGPIPSILITVNPGNNMMHWGDITEQLRRDRLRKSVTATELFDETAVKQILRLATEARPGDWALALASNELASRRIAIEGCFLTAPQDYRTLDSIRAHAAHMSFGDLAFLAERFREECLNFMGQLSLIDFQHEFESDLEELLPEGRSYWNREPYSEDLMKHLEELFYFSKNELAEIIERNLESSVHLDLDGDLTLIRSAARLLDMHPGEHAAALIEISLADVRRSIVYGEGFFEAHTLLAFSKALELDPGYVQYKCEKVAIRVMDVISAALPQAPEIAAAMWAAWNQ